VSSFNEGEDRTASLTASERSLAFKLAENPMELFQGKTVGWLEDFIRITVGTGGRQEGTGENVTGHMAWIAKDLSANTIEYIYEDDSGRYLYTNGVYVSQVTYVDLYEYFGPNAYGPDIGDTFKLPDSRGRAAFFCGTHANAGLGDNDGIALSSRQVYHQHAASVTVSVTGSTSSNSAGTPAGTLDSVSAGTPAGTLDSVSGGTPSGTVGISPNPHSHTIPWGNVIGFGPQAHNDVNVQGDITSSSVTLTATFTGSALAGHAHTFTGSALSAHGHTFTGSALSSHNHTLTGTGSGSGTAGSGMSSDGPAHIYIGSLVVRF
jgi:microcystin-dependent protein